MIRNLLRSPLRPVFRLCGLAALATATVHAVPVSVPNGSFESPIVQVGFGRAIGSSITLESSTPGTPNPALIRNLGSAADGNNHLYLESGSRVLISTGQFFEPETIYVLTLAVGNRDGYTNNANGSTYNLSAGGFVRLGAKTINASTLPVNSSQDATPIVIDTATETSVVGQEIKIRLESTGAGGSEFDHIRVEKMAGRVSTAADSGFGSLRDALETAPDGFTIRFDPAVFRAKENAILVESPMWLTQSRSIVVDAGDIANGITLLPGPGLGNWAIGVDGPGTLELKAFTFRDFIDGGVLSQSGGNLRLSGCLFTGAVASKPTILSAGQSTVITNCTFAEPTGPTPRILSAESNCAVVLRHCTISGAWSGGVIRAWPGTSVALDSCIFDLSGSAMLSNFINPSPNRFSSLGGNVVNIDNLGIFTASNDRTGVTAPMLAPLTWNGGPVRTRIPLPGSVALDNAVFTFDSPADDARGVSRFLRDSGAVEARWTSGYNTAAPGDFGAPASDVLFKKDPVAIFPEGSTTPPTQQIAAALDNDPATKYLNFNTSNAGFTITPTLGACRLAGIGLRSGEDAVNRDPKTFILMGSNISPDAGFQLISAGIVPNFSGRQALQNFYFILGTQSYRHFRIIFPSVRVGEDSLFGEATQLSEVEFYGAPMESDLRVADYLVEDSGNPASPFGWQMSFVSTPGRTYSLQISGKLDDWQTFATGIPADGWITSVGFQDPPLVNVTGRFHRVVEE